MRKFTAAAILLVQAGLLAAIIMPAIVVFADELGLQQQLYNSDTVNVFLLAGDVLNDPASYFRWVVPPSFYLVPDLVLACAILLAGVATPWQMPIFYAVSATLQSLAVGLILSRVRAVPAAFGMWAWAALLVLVGIFGLAADDTLPSTLAFLRAPLAFYHSGALTLSLWGLWILLACAGTGKLRARLLWTLVALVVAGTFSDLVFLVWFVAPAVLALLATGRRTGNAAYRRLALLIAAAGAATFIVEHLLNYAREAYLRASDVWHPLGLLAGYLETFLRAPDIVAIAATFLLLASGWHAFVLFVSGRREDAGNPPNLAALFLGIGASGAVAGFIYVGRSVDLIEYRFLLPAFAYPFIWLLLRPGIARLARPVPAIALAAVPALAAGGIAAFRFDQAPPTMSRDHADLIRCLDREGQVAGLSDYWDAMSVMHASGGRIHAVAIAADGYGYLWNINRDWYFWRRDTGAEARFTYVIMHKLDPTAIAGRFGPPGREISCAGRTIWFYDHPIFPRGEDPAAPR
ncbi:MAG: hypothetical protein AB7O39_00330 [Flavobacteriaceae bacterium]